MIAQELLYQQLADDFSASGVLVSPAELHGHLCGRYVVGHHLEAAFGLRVAADYVDLALGDLEDITQDLETLISQKVLVMDMDLFSFRLFLPEDEVALNVRLEQLASWTEGFLNGVGSTAGDDESRLMKDEQETLADLVEISRLDTHVEESDENEALYAEVCEFVRLAAFNLFDQFRALAKEQEKAAGEPN